MFCLSTGCGRRDQHARVTFPGPEAVVFVESAESYFDLTQCARGRSSI